MKKKGIYEEYVERHQMAKLYPLDWIEFRLSNSSIYDKQSEMLENALMWFAAGYEDALAVYINWDGRAFGAHLLGKLLGMNVNYAKCAHGYLEMIKGRKAVTEEEQKEQKRYLDIIKNHIESAKNAGQMEYKFYEAEYILACGNREEAKTKFLEVYRENKLFAYDAMKRLDELYKEEHPEEFQYREMNVIEKLGENNLFMWLAYPLALVLAALFFPAALILALLRWFAGYTNDRYYEKRSQYTRRSVYWDDAIEDPDMGSYTPVFNEVSNEAFEHRIAKKRTKMLGSEFYEEEITHVSSYQDDQGNWHSDSYTTKEDNLVKMLEAEDINMKRMLDWHDEVKEIVRQHRIENWKRLKMRAVQGDDVAKFLMEAMGFNMEHHNNGVAQLPDTVKSLCFPFAYNAIACWAPHEDADDNN